MENKKNIEKERLDVLLVKKGLCESRQKAQALILAGEVLINEVPVTKAGTSVSIESQIRIRENFPYVSRGSLKLFHAMDHFHIDVAGKTAVDIGASTGGFTQALLERGAARVYAVDCGTNQLDWKLRKDPRVVSMEKTNARFIDQTVFDPRPDLAVIDVSFISLTKILGPVSRILKEGSIIIALIKPQFELDKKRVGKKGLVSSEHRQEALDHVLGYSDSIGLSHSEVIESPIRDRRAAM